MLLLFAWWALLVCAYSAGMAWAHYHAELGRAEYAPDAESHECSPAHAASAARLGRAQTRALYAGLVCGALSTGSLVAHFVTPREALSLGPLGNTTL